MLPMPTYVPYPYQMTTADHSYAYPPPLSHHHHAVGPPVHQHGHMRPMPPQPPTLTHLNGGGRAPALSMMQPPSHQIPRGAYHQPQPFDLMGRPSYQQYPGPGPTNGYGAPYNSSPPVLPGGRLYSHGGAGSPPAPSSASLPILRRPSSTVDDPAYRPPAAPSTTSARS